MSLYSTTVTRIALKMLSGLRFSFSSTSGVTPGGYGSGVQVDSTLSGNAGETRTFQPRSMSWQTGSETVLVAPLHIFLATLVRDGSASPGDGDGAPKRVRHGL